MDLLVGYMLVMGAAVARKRLVAPESRTAHACMVAMSMLTVLRSGALASAYFVVGVGQC